LKKSATFRLSQGPATFRHAATFGHLQAFLETLATIATFRQKSEKIQRLQRLSGPWTKPKIFAQKNSESEKFQKFSIKK